MVAVSSIAHGGEQRGIQTLLRRELIVDETGELVHVPVISGNHLRGRLRRVGEELLREVLAYEGELSPAAAHLLRGGGALVRSVGEPISGSRLREARELVPQVGVFGGAGAGRIIDGALQVGKVLPVLAETSHLTGVASWVSAFNATQLEAFSAHDETESHELAGVIAPAGVDPATGLGDEAGGGGEGRLMRYQVETFPAGTRFRSWVRLRYPSPVQLGFFVDVLRTWADRAVLGGRIGSGHGQVDVDVIGDLAAGGEVDWREAVAARRDEVLAMVEALA